MCFTLLLLFIFLSTLYTNASKNKLNSPESFRIYRTTNGRKGHQSGYEDSLDLNTFASTQTRSHRTYRKSINDRSTSYPALQQVFVARHEDDNKISMRMLVVKIMAAIMPHGILPLAYGFAYVRELILSLSL